MTTDNRICAGCVSDDYLKAEIAASTTVNLACDYCATVGPSIDMWSLALRFDTVIEQFYEVSSETDAVVMYDRDPEGLQLVDILDQIIEPHIETIRSDLEELLKDIWYDRDSDQHQYGEEPWFVERAKCSDLLNTAWEQMEQSLKKQARFVNPAAARLLESVFGPVVDDRTRSGTAVIVEVGPGCEISTLYRARTFQTLAAMEAALRHPERHIGPPPPGEGPAGRMNAKGVSVFYGSTEKQIAIPEVRPPVGSHAVIGAFNVIRKLRLLDMRKLGDVIPKPGGSVFDPATFELSSRCEFLKTLTGKLVMPVMPEQAEQEYLITQATADFLSTHPKLELDGILFPSAQQSLAAPDAVGRNVILFNKAATVVNAEPHHAGDTMVNLWEIDEHYYYFDPEIRTNVSAQDRIPNVPMWLDSTLQEPSLELDRNSLEIREIKGVQYATNDYQVRHSVAVPRVRGS